MQNRFGGIQKMCNYLANMKKLPEAIEKATLKKLPEAKKTKQNKTKPYFLKSEIWLK